MHGFEQSPERRLFLRRFGLVLPAMLALSPVKIALAVAAGQEGKLSFEQFMRLSQQMTGVEHLELHFGRAAYLALTAEPWGSEHLARVESKSSRWLKSPESWQLDRLDEGERWFLGHLLTTWVTGTYYHESGNRVLAYEAALMHQALADIRPVPNLCAQNFGDWEEAVRLKS